MSDDFPWSYSHVDTFNTCPRQYEAKYVTKEVKFQETEATRWGNLVHAAAEDFVKFGAIPPSNIPYTPQFAWVKNRKGTKIAEGDFSVRRDYTPCGFFDHDVWCRSKIDVVVLRDDGIAEVYDWKTGKPKTNRTQLMLYALLVMAKYPEIKEVRTGFIWLREGQLTAPVGYLRMNMDALWHHWECEYAQLKNARDLGVFTPKPSGLCKKWCDVVACDYHGRGAR